MTTHERTPVEQVADPAATEQVVGGCAVYEDGRRRPGEISWRDAGDVARTTTGFVWVGLQQASAADVASVAQCFSLPPLAVEDAVKAHQRPKVERYGDVLFAVLKPVRYVDHAEVIEVGEIALFIGAHFVVTVRHGGGTELRTVREELDAGGEILGPFGEFAVLYRAADLIVDGYEQALTSIDDDIAEIEAQVFSAEGGDHAERIYKLKREVLEFRRAVVPLSGPLQSLAAGGVRDVPAAAAPYFRDVHDHLLRAVDTLEGQDRLLTDVLQANVARVSVQQSAVAVRQNEDMRKISAWAAIALLPTAIAGVYGMNFDNMPELHWQYGYFLVLAVIASACVALYVSFRRNDWL